MKIIKKALTAIKSWAELLAFGSRMIYGEKFGWVGLASYIIGLISLVLSIVIWINSGFVAMLKFSLIWFVAASPVWGLCGYKIYKAYKSAKTEYDF